MKKTFIPLLVVVMALPLVGGWCSDWFGEKATETILESAANDANTNVDVDIDGDGEDGSVTVTTDEGESTTSFGEGVELPGDFPDDVPVYDDASVMITTTDSSREGYYVTMSSTDDFSTIKDWYKKALEDEGWTIDGETSYAAGDGETATFSCTKGDYQLTVGISIYDDELTISLSRFNANM